MSEHNPFVIDVDSAGFEREVLERSKQVPVVVDLWAEWCGPCRMLGPLLEKLAAEYAGKFLLAKVDTEKAPDIAAAFGVRSIPAVFALKDGRVVDSFVGVQSESVIRTFLGRLMPTPAESLVIEAEALEATDPGGAEAKFREAAALAPHESRARIGLARALLKQGRADESREILESLERRGFLEPEAERLKAELTLGEGARDAGGIEAARAAVAASPDDPRARFRLAEALAAAGQHREALEIGLDLVERDRKGVGEEARKLMLAVFQLLPADSELTTEFRRQLSLIL